jgi:predicted nucleotidyltransferase
MDPSASRDSRIPCAEDVERIVQQVVALAEPVRVILFGSAARGDARRDSDVDLLVVVPDGTPCREVTGMLYGTVSGGGIPSDFLVITPSKLEEYRDNPGLIYGLILRVGKEVYAREQTHTPR